jgi:hypothetical protein
MYYQIGGLLVHIRGKDGPAEDIDIRKLHGSNAVDGVPRVSIRGDQYHCPKAGFSISTDAQDVDMRNRFKTMLNRSQSKTASACLAYVITAQNTLADCYWLAQALQMRHITTIFRTLPATDTESSQIPQEETLHICTALFSEQTSVYTSSICWWLCRSVLRYIEASCPSVVLDL